MKAELLHSGNILVEIDKDHPNYAILFAKIEETEVDKSDLDDEGHLAHWYCEMLNTVRQHGKISRKMLEAADHDLHDSGYVVHFQDKTGKWDVEDYKNKEVKRYAHAPVGGIMVNGKFFKGGKFIPTADLMAMDPTQRAMLMGGKRNMSHMSTSRLDWLADRYKRPSSEVSKEKQAELKHRYDAMHKKYGEDTNKRLAEHAHELHDQIGKAHGEGRSALTHQLGQVVGMLAVAGKDDGTEGEKPEAKTITITYRDEGGTKFVECDGVEKEGATYEDALLELVAEIAPKLESGEEEVEEIPTEEPQEAAV